MILLDFNQIMVAQLFQSLDGYTNSEINEDMLRHMVLNKIRYLNVQFKNDYGNIVICADGKNTWRKSIFPYYKANRKKGREESEIDWDIVYQSFNTIRQELVDYFPYKLLHLEGAEADDIIGTICHNYGNDLNTGEKILILSSDKDFIQLQVYGNVFQYAPAQKKWVVHSNPNQFLKEHIFKGDSGDGIPNVMSTDDQLIHGIRQKPVTKKRIENWTSGVFSEEDLKLNIKENIERNRRLIDLSEIPTDLQYQILEEFDKDTKRKGSLLTYFMDKNLKLLTEHISQF